MSSRISSLSVLAFVLGCGRADRTADGPEPFGPGALTCDSPRDGALAAACCPAESLRPVPALAQTVLDLSDPASITAGTCSTYTSDQFPFRRAIPLPVAPEAYPLKMILPAVDARDPGCESLCPPGDDGVERTAFGIAITTGTPETGYLIGGNSGRVLAISVPPPWYFVSGGCGEACAWPCLEGYQEFGVRSCISLAHGDFGFATRDPRAPSVEAVIELITVDGPIAEYAPNGCCVFAGDAR